jgi:nucleoside-diphosphate-sugar epimerase
MKILITGGCGFIGSELIKQLVEKGGYEITVADNLSKPESSIKQGYKFVNIDLTDKQATENLFKQGFDICVNLAAKIGGIGYFHKIPAVILSENNKIYSSTFEAAVKYNLPRMIYISSSMVFESAEKFPSKEEDLSKTLPPLSSYGFSKLVGEQYCHAFNTQFGLKFSICRPFNAYGINEAPGEEVGYAHVIPDLIKKILNSDGNLEILGDGEQTRCFTHISDLARGIIAVIESPEAINQDFNIGSSDEIKISDLAEKLWKLCGKKEKLNLKFVKGFEHDVKRRTPDTSKIKKLLGWEQKILLDDGLKEVINWIKNYKS